MRVVALKAFSTGTLTMEEKQVKDIPDDLANELIAKGIVADAATYFGGGSGGGGFLALITETEGTYSCDKTFAELTAAANNHTINVRLLFDREWLILTGYKALEPMVMLHFVDAGSSAPYVTAEVSFDDTVSIYSVEQ